MENKYQINQPIDERIDNLKKILCVQIQLQNYETRIHF